MLSLVKSATHFTVACYSYCDTFHCSFTVSATLLAVAITVSVTLLAVAITVCATLLAVAITVNILIYSQDTVRCDTFCRGGIFQLDISFPFIDG